MMPGYSSSSELSESVSTSVLDSSSPRGPSAIFCDLDRVVGVMPSRESLLNLEVGANIGIEVSRTGYQTKRSAASNLEKRMARVVDLEPATLSRD